MNGIQLLLKGTCDYPSGMKYIHVTYMMTLTLFFSNFYIQSYLKKGKKNLPTSENTGPDSSTEKIKKIQ